MPGNPDHQLRRIQDLLQRQELPGEAEAQPVSKRDRLRYLARQTYLLVLLTSPIWFCLLVLKFAPPVTTVFFALIMGGAAATTAVAILMAIRQLNRLDDRRSAIRPPDPP
jgi:hypothetical protein